MKRIKGFTIIELLVVISIIALLIGILLPAISRARDTAKVTASASNLKNLAAAHELYSAEWNDKHFTLVKEDVAYYGGVAGYQSVLGAHPPILMGWNDNGDLIAYWMSWAGNHNLVWPINPNSRYGWFRLCNARQFNQYVNGRFYDLTFYAPKDKVAIDLVEPLANHPGEFVETPSVSGLGELPYWTSYVLSPAALFSPGIMDAQDPQLSSDMAAMPAGAFKVPSMSSARHPSLKTHMLEHHWLQGNRGITCNPAFVNGTYDGCEPFYFNHAYESAPVTMFYDGSVRVMGAREAIESHQAVSGGLYFTPNDGVLAGAGALSSDGYYLGAGYDFSTEGAMSNGYHILTKDGALGRDTVGSSN